MSIDAASYSALNKIYKLLDGSLDTSDEMQLKSINAAIDWQDVNAGSEHSVVLAELPEGSVLLHAQAYITTTFYSGSESWYAQLRVGIQTQEFDEVDYKDKIASNYKLNGTGFKSVTNMNGGLASAAIDQVLNYKPNQLVANFSALGNWTASNNLNTARRVLAGAGTQSAALSFGGYNGSYSATTEEYFSNAGNAYTQQLTAGALTFKAKYIRYES